MWCAFFCIKIAKKKKKKQMEFNHTVELQQVKA